MISARTDADQDHAGTPHVIKQTNPDLSYSPSVVSRAGSLVGLAAGQRP
jgi:hypothetical protein